MSRPVALFVISLVEFVSHGNVVGHSVDKRSTTVCYHRVGCFHNGPPYNSNRILTVNPASPNTILTKFFLFTRHNEQAGEVLDARFPEQFSEKWPKFDPQKPVAVIVHGFLDTIYINTWQNDTKSELMKHGDYNVIVVDWGKGNKPPYTQATANGRLVGAQIADLINTIKETTNLDVANVHLIGHSLGAHACGHAGERIPGLGRISGLDPAGPFYEGTDRLVRLDETDAVFVDVIHSDAESLLQLGVGIRQSVGHVDFFPNFGHDQPGCDASPVQKFARNNFIMGLQEVFECNHLRAVQFFLESINSKCPYMAHPCSSADAFAAGSCGNCAGAGCARMGFHAKKLSNDATSYYLTTNDRKPFCEYHTQLSIRMKSNTGTERGQLKVKVVGSEATSQWESLNKDPQDFKGGNEYDFVIGTPAHLGEIQTVSLSWTHKSHPLNPFKWNVLGLRHPKLYPDQITLRQEEISTEARICSTGANMETGEVLTLGLKC